DGGYDGAAVIAHSGRARRYDPADVAHILQYGVDSLLLDRRIRAEHYQQRPVQPFAERIANDIVTLTLRGIGVIALPRRQPHSHVKCWNCCDRGYDNNSHRGHNAVLGHEGDPAARGATFL